MLPKSLNELLVYLGGPLVILSMLFQSLGHSCNGMAVLWHHINCPYYYFESKVLCLEGSKWPNCSM